MSRFLHSILGFKLGAGLRTTTVVGVSGNVAAWLERTSGGLTTWRNLGWQDGSPSDALAKLNAELGLAQFRSGKLIFSPSMLRHWLQTPPRQVASLRELRNVAQARCSLLFGEAPQSETNTPYWSVSANWHASRPFVCFALPTVWAEAVQAQTHTPNASWHLAAQALEHYRAVLPTTGWLALVLANHLYLFQLKSRSVVSLRAVQLPMLPEATLILQAVKEEWGREMLRKNCSAPILSCLYFRPGAPPLVVPSGVDLLPTKIDARIPEPPENGQTNSPFSEAGRDAVLTAWCAEQFVNGHAQ